MRNWVAYTVSRVGRGESRVMNTVSRAGRVRDWVMCIKGRESGE